MLILSRINNNKDAENIPPIKEQTHINIKLMFINLSFFLNQKINTPSKININKYTKFILFYNLY
jgi:hypothetical protein